MGGQSRPVYFGMYQYILSTHLLKIFGPDYPNVVYVAVMVFMSSDHHHLMNRITYHMSVFISAHVFSDGTVRCWWCTETSRKKDPVYRKGI